ncbi:hypothetical protein D3C85_1776110 [compost metagenome]
MKPLYVARWHKRPLMQHMRTPPYFAPVDRDHRGIQVQLFRVRKCALEPSARCEADENACIDRLADPVCVLTANLTLLIQ